MADIKFLPLQLENAVLNLDESQLHVPYREGGWTVQQVVHHVADSHMNAYIRFKLGLTEDNPAIRHMMHYLLHCPSSFTIWSMQLRFIKI